MLYPNDLKSWEVGKKAPRIWPGEADAETAKLKKFSDAGGGKFGGCPTKPKTNFSSCLGIHSFRNFKKFNLSLLEVMLALVLTGGLLSVLFFNYLQIETKIQKVIQNKQEVLALQVMQLRLSQVFEQTLQEPFYVEDGALFFHFNGGIDIDPLFCDQLQCKLFLNANTLTLSYSGKNGEIRQDLFLSNIGTLSFSFFDQTKMQWTEKWEKTRQDLPNMIQIISPKSRQVFFIPNAKEKNLLPIKKKFKV